MNDNVGTIEYDARINTSQLKGDARKTESIVEDTGDNVERTGKRSFGEFATWAKVGLAAAGVATVALAGNVIKTGIEYNTLQQTSRAALTTILGGAQAANAQMDKLDEFARTSPFAKDVFIQAQQQLLGFGVEASKVIPTLNAIQQSVAAVGGSSADISAITDVLAKIQAQGRLSGEELLQLGGYGIDAASIIGEQMGKSGQEIRDMASKPGGIPVGEIWDPLTNGLTDKFGGAADNVKNTFSGTMDRITAAFRDIGSAIAAPFVDPKGGGMAISWGNTFADTLRSVQKGVGPMVEAIKSFIGEVALALKPVTDFIANNTQAWEVLGMALKGIAIIIGVLIVSISVGLILAFAAIQAVINFVVGLFENLIQSVMRFIDSIRATVDAVKFFGSVVGSVFASIWNNIVNTFNNALRFIRDIWNKIVSIFQTVGAMVGNAIGNSFRAVINGIVRGAVGIINGLIDAINGAVDVINNIPGVELGKIGRLPVPQLASGGVVTSPTLAMIGEGRESEAVIPLSKLDSMLEGDTKNGGNNYTIEVNMNGIMTRSRADTRAVAQDLVESLNEKLRASRLPEIGDGNLRRGVA